MSVTTDAETSEPSAPAQPLLELYGAIKPDGHADAVMGVRWCSSPALMNALKMANSTRPYVLLVVRPFHWVEDDVTKLRRKVYDGQTLRKLVPLTAEFAYVSFRRPGNNEVLATVVYNTENSGANFGLNPVFLAGKPYHYAVDLFDYDGHLMPGYKERETRTHTVYSGVVLPDCQDSLDVEVPTEMFAKEYPAIIQQYVGKFFPSQPKDQCRMRRRLLFFAAPFAPIYFPLAYALRVLQLAVGSLFGLRGMHLRSFVHPVKYGILDVTNDDGTDAAKGSMWWTNKNGEERPILLWPFNPATVTILTGIIWLLGRMPYHNTVYTREGKRVVSQHTYLLHWLGHVNLLHSFIWSVAIHLAVVAAMLVIIVIGSVVSLIAGSSLSDSIDHKRESRKSRLAREKEARNQEMIQKLESQLATMTCKPASHLVALDALPKEKQTIWLRMQSTKNRVCKPFAS